MAHQSLYRRYRPRNFAEIKGQPHVVTALRNAVADDSAAHAYLFSGPRGTGKTSTARIFAKALNCTALVDGEPCCECDSCLSIQAGNSFDLFELDAASNNGVEAVRDLVERTMVASPGRTKVYILDEVHMLTTAASNALLKTLEEPPGHVRFVLATTDPQKVLPTIRSRAQHFEFRLLSAAELTEHAEWVTHDAGLDVDREGIAHAVKRGRGSVRDMLSALDQVVAAGGVLERSEPVDDLFAALTAGTEASPLAVVAEAIAAGHDPRVLAEAFVAEVRAAFLLAIGVDDQDLVDTDRERLGNWARELGTAGLSSTMERIGSALVDMRSAADPRVPLEVALIQLGRASRSGGAHQIPDGVAGSGDAERSPHAEAGPGGSAAPVVPTGVAEPAELAELRSRIDELEAALARLGSSRVEATGDQAPAESHPTPPAASEEPGSEPGSPERPQGRSGRPKPPPPPPRRRRPGPVSQKRSAAEPAQQGRDQPSAPPGPDAASANPAVADVPPADTRTPGASSQALPERDTLVMTFGDSVVPNLKGIAKAIYSQGRFVSVEGDHAVFAVENAPTRDRAERYRSEVESLLDAELGVAVPLRLVVEGEVGAPMSASSSASPGPPAGAGRPGGPDGDPGPEQPEGTARLDPGAEPETSVQRSGSGTSGEHTGSRVSPSPGGASPRAPDPPAGDPPAGDPPAGDASGDEEAEIMAQVAELENADVRTSTVDRLTAAFPGAELIESEESN